MTNIEKKDENKEKIIWNKSNKNTFARGYH